MLGMEKKINAFIERLASEQVGSLTENIYLDKHKQENLRLYLMALCKNKPTYMLVGEAPGYKGCGVTGIPFTDENEMKNHLGTYQEGYFFENIKCLQKENSAGIIWGAIQARNDGKIPLMWNAYPFHPFKENKRLSNRKPNKTELIVGKSYLEELIDIFKIPKNDIYAVGRVAQSQLGYLGAVKYICHPSHGGKAECVNGILSIK